MKKFLLISLSAVPMLAFGSSGSSLTSLLDTAQNLLTKLLPFLLGLAMLGFFWGLVKFIFNGNNDEGREEGKKMMIYAVVALFVMTAVWGLVGFIGNTIGVTPGDTGAPTIVLPKVTN